MGYKVRFHLQRGNNFRKWQIKSADGSVEYVCPIEHSLKLKHVKLFNRVSVASKINEGANKSVCAWMFAEEVNVLNCSHSFEGDNFEEIRYNPKVLPYWECSKMNVDGSEYTCLITIKNKVFKKS